jgi:formylglycine-generating enzyme required for sulfatase activity
VTGRTTILTMLALVGLAGLVGCGEQDLYQPPDSPYNRSGAMPLRASAAAVDVLGDYAYIAGGEAGLQVFDISDPAHPQLAGWLDTPKRADAIRVARTYDADGSARDIAFIVEGTEGIPTYDVTDPTSIVDFQQGTTAVDGKGLCFVPAEIVGESYTVYLADSWKGVRVYFSAPERPGVLDYIAFVSTYGYTQALDVVDGYAYVAEDEMGLTSIDVTNVRTGGMQVIDNVDTPGLASDVDVVGDFAFVADGDEGLQVIKIDEQHHLSLVATLKLNGRAVAIVVWNQRAFIAGKDGGLNIVDVRDPYHPVYLGNNPSTDAVDVAVSPKNLVCVADSKEGLLVYTGTPEPLDDTPPAAVADLATRLENVTSLDLSWTAPGDDGTTGTANLYEVRVAEQVITETTWGQALAVIARPLPKEAGTPQTCAITDLSPGHTYYFALKTRDEAANISPLSNVAMAIMTTPSLSAGVVTPDSGDVATEFSYTVVYQDPEGDAPARAEVRIDGEAHTMALAGPEPDYTIGAAFVYRTMVARGSHQYQFAFDDGHGPLVTTSVLDGPKMPANPFGFESILVDVGQGATFTMGSPASELGRAPDENAHQVTLTHSFYVASIEASQALYAELTDQRPAYFAGDFRPVEQVTWYDALALCNLLSDHDGLDPAYTISGQVYDGEDHLIAARVTWDPAANGWRLPTEAEWEYACRAGTATALANGPLTHRYCEPDAGLDAIGWYCGNADQGAGPRTQDSARKDANPLGLYDMHGNVWEWCWDRYADYPAGPVTDPTGPDGELWQQRVRRGGSWYYYARDCRSASRGAYWPGSPDNTTGFRMVRNAE